MKKLLLLVAIVATLSANVFASINDPSKALSLKEGSTKPYKSNSRFEPTFEFSTNPVSLVDNFYDYFPGSYTGSPMQRVDNSAIGGINGNWIVYHTKTTANGNRRVYKAFVDATGAVSTNTAFGTNDIWEGYAGVAVTEGGRPMFAYHVNMDGDADLEVGFGYDALLGGTVMEMHSSLEIIIDNMTTLEVNGTVYDQNEFIWPSVQIADSPVAGSQRMYVMGKNASTVGSAVSENVFIVYKDFTDADIENQVFDGTGWGSTTIPMLDNWNVSTGEWRRPYMAFIAHEDKIYYAGYHIAYTESGEEAVQLDEPTTDVFICDNYGEGTWVQNSIYSSFNSYNPNYINPTGDHEGEEMATEYFTDVADDELIYGIGQSGHFNASMDNIGRINFSAFYTLKTTTGSYYPGLHIVKNISFDTNTLEWQVSDVYPQGPNSVVDVTGNTTSGTPADVVTWMAWDMDADGLHDEILDDGTWDG
ncbi:MAG: hypothetical protein B6226_00695, partial [Candidatus Cloacimonetes bacterium 4572_65]